MTDFALTCATDNANHLIRLSLRDRNGVHLGANQVRVSDLDRELWHSLLDTRAYIRKRCDAHVYNRETGLDAAAQLLTRIGTFLADDILGAQITAALAQSPQRRTLRIHLPDTANDPLAAALARVPWECARIAVDEADLLDRNLIVVVTTDGMPDRDAQVAEVAQAVTDGATPLRVLLVYADATESMPLAWRHERESLMRRFERDIMPYRNVTVDVLCHGVNRDLLRERITASGGYHIIHWSGHGLRDRLELRGVDGTPEPLSGRDIVALIEQAGGFIPQIVFLAACLSGTLFDVRNRKTWYQADEQADEQAHEPDVPRPPTPGEHNDPLDILSTSSGSSGTALALLQAGVPQTVAMRYRVSDGFARELAGAFYSRLLADREPRSVESALHLARRDVADRGSHMARRVLADRANPLMLGHPGRLLVPVAKRSSQMRRLQPLPQPLVDGDDRLARPERFVGRTQQLTALHLSWLAHGASRAVALIRGDTGMGKTMLAAEALHLWHGRFDWVLAFCAAEQPLAIDAFYRQVDARLTVASKVYRERCEDNPYQHCYLEPDRTHRGQARYERMRTNLIEALQSEAILLVLDGFQSNLEAIARAGAHACTDPEWDLLFAALLPVLPATRSRLLMTSSLPPAAIAKQPNVLDIELGLLPEGEARLFIQVYDALNRLMLADNRGYALGARLLQLADGHPEQLSRLADLAADSDALAAALDRLEQKAS